MGDALPTEPLTVDVTSLLNGSPESQDAEYAERTRQLEQVLADATEVREQAAMVLRLAGGHMPSDHA